MMAGIASPDPTQDAPCLCAAVLPPNYLEGHDTVPPAPMGRRYRNTGGRVFRVTGAADRWYVAQERAAGLRECERYGKYETPEAAQAALDESAKAMRMVVV